MLSEKYGADSIRAKLISRDNYHPFPRYGEKKPLDDAAAVKEAVCNGEQYLGRVWGILPAIRYGDFARDGNRSRFEALYFERRTAIAALLFAEYAEQKGRFANDIINLVWAVCEESTWVLPAHNNHSAKAPRALPDVEADIYIDLFSAMTGSLLTWVHYFLADIFDKESPLIARRIAYEIERRIIVPYAASDFHWTGLANPNDHPNNWNPWINSNVLPAILVLDSDDERRTLGVVKSMASIDRFLAGYHPDGGCDEGPGYWNAAGASLFDYLDILHTATDGAVNVFSEPLIGNIGRYIMGVHIADDYFVNFADSPPVVGVSADLIRRYGEAVGDAALTAFGTSKLAGEKPPHSHAWMSFRGIRALLNRPENRRRHAEPPLVASAWMEGIQVMTARETAGSTRGLFVAAKGGHNAESHNHNDVGSFIVYADGKPVIIDAGVETYTKKTFSRERYEIWTMRSPYHNLPAFNGIEQQAGRQFAARDVRYVSDKDRVSLSMDIASAFPETAGIRSCGRTVALDRALHAVIVTDEFVLAKPGSAVFSLMTSRDVAISETVITLSANGERSVRIALSGLSCAVSAERIAIHDERLGSWGDHITRILLNAGVAERGLLKMEITQR
ncbi:MAG: heparinase II/III family protein [Spirochaetes bacterium]|nr:heparinase II/III family protein [Spirochaetota bacterium]